MHSRLPPSRGGIRLFECAAEKVQKHPYAFSIGEFPPQPRYEPLHQLRYLFRRNRTSGAFLRLWQNCFLMLIYKPIRRRPRNLRLPEKCMPPPRAPGGDQCRLEATELLGQSFPKRTEFLTGPECGSVHLPLSVPQLDDLSRDFIFIRTGRPYWMFVNLLRLSP